jgi:hypothetical protein
MLYENAHYKIAHCKDCSIPGYLIVLPKTEVATIAELSESAQQLLGSTLNQLQAADINGSLHGRMQNIKPCTIPIMKILSKSSIQRFTSQLCLKRAQEKISHSLFDKCLL